MARHDDISQRTHEPTPLRLAEARRGGQVARSADLSGTLVMLAGLGLLAAVGPGLLTGMTALMAEMLGAGEAPGGDAASLGALLWASLAPLLPACGLIAGGVVLAAVLANLVQVGPLVATERVCPDLSRISPSEGFRRLLSLRSWVRAGLGLVRIAAVTAVVWTTLDAWLGRIVSTAGVPAADLAPEAGRMAWRLGLRIGAVLLALAGVDWLYQRWQRRRDLRMTPQEVREDLREADGDPLTKRRRRERMRRLKQAWAAKGAGGTEAKACERKRDANG